MKPNTLSRRAAMLLAGVALPMSTPAFAQAVDGSAANEYADRGEALDTVVVTAMRREENLAKVPASITALTRTATLTKEQDPCNAPTPNANAAASRSHAHAEASSPCWP